MEKNRDINSLIVEALLQQEDDREEQAPKCEGSCYGEGFAKFTSELARNKCSRLSDEIKNELIEMACTYADRHEDELKEKAKYRADRLCREVSGDNACLCEGEYRKAKGTYTGGVSAGGYSLHKHCIAYCGWVYEGTCHKETDDGEEKEGSDNQ